MRRAIRQLIPSMFLRRLLLLGLGAAVMLIALMTQLSWLTLAEGADRRVNAEAALSQYEFSPTSRGRILGAKGRVLAEDELSYDVAVNYAVITGTWTYRKAYHEARSEHRSVWSELGYVQRQRFIAEHETRISAKLESFWELMCEFGQIERSELEERKAEIKRRVQQMASAVWLQRVERRSDEFAEEGNEVQFADVAQPIGPQVEAHAVLQGVDESVRGRIRKYKNQAETGSIWHQVTATVTRQRHYPFDKVALTLDRSTMPTPLRGEALDLEVRGVAMHTIGAMRKVQAEDVATRPFRLADGDLDSGLEKRQLPRQGNDVQLSIDIYLQARIQAIMTRKTEDGPGLMNAQTWHGEAKQPEGAPLNGAAIVLHIPTGKVLASVSVPTFDRHTLSNYSNLVFTDDVGSLDQLERMAPGERARTVARPANLEDVFVTLTGELLR